MKEADLIFDFCVETLEGQKFFLLSKDVNWHRQTPAEVPKNGFMFFAGEPIQRNSWSEILIDDIDAGVQISPVKKG